MNQKSVIQGANKPILPALLRQYGVWRVTFAVTLISVLISVTATSTILYFAEGAISPTGVLISIIVPLVLAPISSYNNNRLVHRLDMAEERLRLLSNTDALTGTFNRRYFFEQVAREFERAQRYDHQFSFAILDFDNFKNINDGYSHLVGDEVLKCVAGVCLANLRQTDVFARYGGDEFVFSFPIPMLCRQRNVSIASLSSSVRQDINMASTLFQCISASAWQSFKHPCWT